MARIKKALIETYGDESHVRVVEGEIGEPGAKEVQVRVEYSVVSGADINMRKGIYPMQKRGPITPGYCIVGLVERNGAGSTRFTPGTRVACLTKYDGQAELVNLPERFLVEVPEGVDPKQAVGLVLDWVTAYQMVVRVAKVKPGQRVFVHGLSGAVGRALLALVKLQGADVYGTASEKNHAELRELGAVPFPYSDKSWIAAMRTFGGADAVFDPLGYSSFAESYSILRRGGILVGYGMNLPTLTGAKTRSPWPMMLGLLAKNLAFWRGRRTWFYGVTRTSKYYQPDLRTLLELLKAGKITVPVKCVFRLDAIQEAHRAWASSTGMGTIVIDVQGAGAA